MSDLQRYAMVAYEHGDQMDKHPYGMWVLYADHITELTRFRKEVADWREAARPFADVARKDIGDTEDDGDTFRPIGLLYARAKRVTVGDFRRLAALTNPEIGDAE